MIYVRLQQTGILLLFLIILAIIFFILRTLTRFIKRKLLQSTEKAMALHEKRKIRNIAKEESIRASVKKSINESNDDSLDDLQALINKAVADDDSETAKALLKILNSKKKD